MNIPQFLRKYRTLLIVGCLYLLLSIISPNTAIAAIKNSLYYLREMFEVLPVIFLLTVVIDVLIPREWIIKHLGASSGIGGKLLALLFGSLSAGPIYAAFPISRMLLSKGAGISNIIIIMSSWAVIKVPMLANEAKFLGVEFMGIRWGLTVAAIFLLAEVAGRILKPKDIISPGSESSPPEATVHSGYCVGCGICERHLPEVFGLMNKKAFVKADAVNAENRVHISALIQQCPTRAISMQPE